MSKLTNRQNTLYDLLVGVAEKAPDYWVVLNREGEAVNLDSGFKLNSFKYTPSLVEKEFKLNERQLVREEKTSMRGTPCWILTYVD